MLGGERVIKMFGLGFAAAILIEATLIRVVIVPATMELLGDANWWLPRWLNRLLPHLDVEGSPQSLDEELQPVSMEPTDPVVREVVP